MGFLCWLKATAGGGGKGMRVVEKEKDLATSIEAAKRESLSAFGNDELIMKNTYHPEDTLNFKYLGISMDMPFTYWKRVYYST